MSVLLEIPITYDVNTFCFCHNAATISLDFVQIFKICGKFQTVCLMGRKLKWLERMAQ